MVSPWGMVCVKLSVKPTSNMHVFDFYNPLLTLSIFTYVGDN